MKLYRFASYLIIIVLLPLLSCEKTIIEQVSGPNGNGKLYAIEGHAQKGPFIVGTDVTVAELNDKLFPTGRVFFSTILDDEGQFKLPGVVLESPYVQIKITGKYFSETQNNLVSEGTITLFSIADIRETETINVNILTHLEKERVEYLVQEQNKSFTEAKEQALNELLSIFNLESFSVDSSEGLTIFDNSDGNGVLLAISSIIEGLFDYEKRLHMITVFQNDFEDGTLDDLQTQKRLITSAKTLDAELITEHLHNRFPNSTIPEFASYISEFIDHTDYIDYFQDIFPKQPNGWINLLEQPNTEILNSNVNYKLELSLPEVDQTYVEIYFNADYNANNGTFSATSTAWNSEVGYDCLEPDCHSARQYYYNNYYSTIKQFDIPITWSGHGERLWIRMYLSIDGFSYPLQGDWNLNW